MPKGQPRSPGSISAEIADAPQATPKRGVACERPCLFVSSALVDVVACPDTGIRSRARDPDSDVAAHTRLTEMHKYMERMLAILSADGEREMARSSRRRLGRAARRLRSRFASNAHEWPRQCQPRTACRPHGRRFTGTRSAAVASLRVVSEPRAFTLTADQVHAPFTSTGEALAYPQRKAVRLERDHSHPSAPPPCVPSVHVLHAPRQRRA